MKYLDPVALAQLKSLSLGLRRLAAEGHMPGRHRGAAKGPSHEFAQHRAYVPGDELRGIDWKVYARQDRYYIREYQSESLLDASLLVDASGSMGFGSKWDLACRLAMAVSYLVLSRGDAAGLLAFEAEPRTFVPARGSLAQLEALDAALAHLAPGGETDLGGALERAALRLRRRSLVVLVSDLLGEPESLLKVVRAFQARRHELMVLQVLDPRERDFGYEGSVVFESLEAPAELYCDATALGPSYRAEFARALKLYEAAFHGAGIPYAAFYTGRPWADGLARLLGRRG